MTRPKLSSEQESIVEELIQSSFGAQFLYTPKLFKRGQNSNEPCDLMWFGNGVLVLFYLTTGNQTLLKQDAHNLKQARRWNTFWRKNKSTSLVGTNRYGDELSIKRADVNNIINISVIGHNTGIVFHPSNLLSTGELTCTIPEQLIHEIATFHGTVIDLLSIIYSYSQEFQRHLFGHRATAPLRLQSIIKNRKEAIQAAITRNATPDESTEDLGFIHEIIGKNRLPDPFGSAISGGADGNTRDKLAAYFSDLSALDYAIIAITAKEAISKTDGGKLSITASTNGLHTNWIVFATNLGINNMSEVLENFRTSLEKSGRSNLPQIIYGHPREIFDYRSPLMYVFPRNREKSQASDLTQRTIQRISAISAGR